jgi:putative membrane protein
MPASSTCTSISHESLRAATHDSPVLIVSGHLLSAAEASAIEARSAEVEARVGIQIVAAIIDKADAHVELPWKAFAMGAVLAGLALVVADAVRPQWLTANAALVDTVTILACGGASALLAIFAPSYARLFLRSTRRDYSVRRHAQTLFLERGLFATRQRNGVLILVSCFERRVELLADTGLHQHVSEAQWRPVIARMTPLLRERRFADALLAGLAATEKLLAGKGFKPAPGTVNELPDRPIEESGSA